MKKCFIGRDTRYYCFQSCLYRDADNRCTLNDDEFNANVTDTLEYIATCEYMARTEMFDRTLTDARSRYDPTEAFVQDTHGRMVSSSYAKMVLNEIIMEYGVEYVSIKEEVMKHRKYSAQGWIDEWDRIVELGRSK